MGVIRGSLTGVSLAQIEYFVAVAEEGHVGRAAQKLHVAQPAVSRQIRKLEDELRAPLFLRTPRGMRLSEAGTIFLRHAREILGGVEIARDAVQQTIATVPRDLRRRRPLQSPS
jgi:DNA-binding transcriptional LysR family regulator